MDDDKYIGIINSVDKRAKHVVGVEVLYSFRGREHD